MGDDTPLADHPATRFGEVPPIGPETEETFANVRVLCEDNVAGLPWAKVLDDDKKELQVLVMDTEYGRIFRFQQNFRGLSPGNVFDCIMDDEYASEWDKYAIDAYGMCRISRRTDIGYYSLKTPIPLKNRDWVLSRSWWTDAIGNEGAADGTTSDITEAIIVSHSVEHPKAPVIKDCIRARGLVAARYAKKTEDGCTFYYVALNDLNGDIPSFILDHFTKVLAPTTMNTFREAIHKYPEWKTNTAKGGPDYKPWVNMDQCDLPSDLDSDLIPESPLIYRKMKKEQRKWEKKMARSSSTSSLSSGQSTPTRCISRSQSLESTLA